MGQKNYKGAVTISDADGRIRLRWRYQSRRYSLNLFQYSRKNFALARKTALQIELDMVQGSFDCSLAKYKGEELLPETGHAKSIVQSFEGWAKNYKQLDCDVNIGYYTIRNMLCRWGDIGEFQLLQKLNQENLAPKTYNCRLSVLRHFSDYMVRSGLWKSNPLEGVCPRKLKRTKPGSRMPFTVQDIERILDAVRTNQFSSKASRYPHAHYYPFLYFIFKTGVRNAEAVGLRAGAVDWEARVIHIRETLARSTRGTHAGARVRKETKNGKERKLPLTPDLAEVLAPLMEGKNADDLLFTSFSKKAIDDRMFQRRVFKPILKGLGIQERDLYACRHTFGSRCISEGISPVMTSFLMGNNPETALRNYTHQITLPPDLPSI
jgi:integrase